MQQPFRFFFLACEQLLWSKVVVEIYKENSGYLDTGSTKKQFGKLFFFFHESEFFFGNRVRLVCVFKHANNSFFFSHLRNRDGETASE